MWELVGPDGAEKSISGLGQQRFTLDLETNSPPRFEMTGLLNSRMRQML